MNSVKTPKDNVILVTIDFSSASDRALEHAVGIADLFDNEITLLYVVKESFFKSIFGSAVERDVLMGQLKERLEAKKQEVQAKYPKLHLNIVVKEGTVYKQILHVAEESHCDSIVMGYHGDSAVEQVLGSTTSRVLRSSHVPVVIVKEVPAKTQYDRILLPIDLTRESRQKVSWAIHIAKKYDSEIHVIMEVEQDEFLMNKVRNNLNQVEHLLEKEGVRFVSKLLDDQHYPDEFGKDILKYSEESDIDLILIMTQKETGIMDFFLGSFARQVVQGSKNTPVMAINPKELAVKLVPGY